MTHSARRWAGSNAPWLDAAGSSAQHAHEGMACCFTGIGHTAQMLHDPANEATATIPPCIAFWTTATPTIAEAMAPPRDQLVAAGG